MLPKNPSPKSLSLSPGFGFGFIGRSWANEAVRWPHVSFAQEVKGIRLTFQSKKFLEQMLTHAYEQGRECRVRVPRHTLSNRAHTGKMNDGGHDRMD